jgi:heat shock protein HslJ
MKSFVVYGLLIFLAGCKSTRPALSKQEKPLPPPVLSESMLQKQLNGVDFFAKGGIPVSWTLEMDFGNIIRFKSLDGNDINSSAVSPVEQPGGKTVSYTSRSTNGQVNILVSGEVCTDAISGEKYSKKVVVTVNAKRYEGCGLYLFDAALDGKWILEKINNRSLSAADFSKGLPEFIFELAQNKVSGHDGCNTLSSTLEVLGNKIKLSPFLSTKMACPNSKAENNFLHLLSNQTIDYYFKDGQLFFYLPDDSIIVFRRG